MARSGTGVLLVLMVFGFALASAPSARAASTSCWIPRSVLKSSVSSVVVQIRRGGNCSFAVVRRALGRPTGISFRVTYPQAVVAENDLFRPRHREQGRCFYFNNDKYCE